MSAEEKTSVLDADKLIDEILAAKGPQKYKNGLSEDNWEEELEQIPLFMSKVPDKIDPEKGAGILALQDLKYQEDDPDCCALAYKEDGNELFKHKKYKEAVTAYSEGLKQCPTDTHLTTILHCNRAASHYHLGNYRSSILDATKSKTIKPDHLKAYIRGAEANYKLGKHKDTIDWCEEGLRIDPTNKQLQELRAKSAQDKRKFERDQRKKGIAEQSKIAEQRKLFEAIKVRRIRLSELEQENANEDDLKTFIDSLSLTDPHPISKPVHLSDQGELIWPVVLLYPEYKWSEVILEFNETSRFVDHIRVMFGGDPVPWDEDRKYTPQTIEVWYEDLSNNKYVPVELSSSLADVLNGSSRYTVVSGTPSFIILAKGSKFKTIFLHKS